MIIHFYMIVTGVCLEFAGVFSVVVLSPSVPFGLQCEHRTIYAHAVWPVCVKSTAMCCMARVVESYECCMVAVLACLRVPPVPCR